jgi:hypothetical protein
MAKRKQNNENAAATQPEEGATVVDLLAGTVAPPPEPAPPTAEEVAAQVVARRDRLGDLHADLQRRRNTIAGLEQQLSLQRRIVGEDEALIAEHEAAIARMTEEPHGA